MELLNNIWNALTTPNETLINIILLPSAIIETILTLMVFTTVFNLKPSTKQNIAYILSYSILTFLTAYFIPSPWNVFINYIGIFVLICFIFKTSFLQGLFASLISTLLIALVGSLILNPYFTILNITLQETATIPIYRILYLFFMYFIVFCIIILLKLKKYKIEFPDYTIDKRNKKVLFINTAKGFDPEEDITISTLIRKIIPFKKRGEVTSLLGPSHAEEVILRHITLISAVSKDEEAAKKVQQMFANDYFRVYTLKDEIGAEYQVAMKNAIALASGMIEGLKLGDNARAALVTRGLLEIGRLAHVFGAKKETLYGLTGVGDLIVTCYSYHSRNFEAGLKIGLDDDVKDFLKTNKKTVEGIRTVKVLHELGHVHKIHLPIIEALYQIIYEGAKPSTICRELMLRPLKSED